jgi:seryl-tRNA synthetase
MWRYSIISLCVDCLGGRLIGESFAQLEKKAEKLEADLRSKVSLLGNIVHESVPVSKDEVRECE